MSVKDSVVVEQDVYYYPHTSGL